VQQHKVVLALVPALVLAGCIGGLGADTGPSDSADVSPEQVPGITNGTLSNASALVEANRNAVTTTGAILQVNQSSDRMTIDARLVVGANFSTYSLSGTGSVSDGPSTTLDQWSNETTQFVRTSSDEETNYQVLDGHDDRLTILSSVEEFLSAGDFEVANDTSGDGNVVLTADSASAADTSTVDAESFDSRLVVTESGQIQNLSVTATRDGETVTYSYELRQAGVDSVPKPDWVDDVPPGATVQAQLSIDVENDSYLTLEHSGGDVVPSATTVRVESNGTTDTASLDSSLSAGDTRYVYFDGSSQELRVTADRPEQSTVSPVTSPVSVRVVTEGGAVLSSGSMAWDSSMASESGNGNGADSSSGSTAGSDNASSSSSESMTVESTNATATPPR
jgi:hypothetical protein